MKKISNDGPNREEPTNYPTLPPLDLKEVEWIQSKMSRGKGLTYDGWSDNFLKKVDLATKGHLIKDLWNPSSMQLMPDITWARLIPLNKVWPNIPTEDNFRPVVVLSAMYKFLELRFLPKLQNYLSLRLDKN